MVPLKSNATTRAGKASMTIGVVNLTLSASLNTL